METTRQPYKVNNKNVLLISYHFPPSPAVGGVRIANFAKYLPLYDWNTYVLTVKDHYLGELDADRLKDIGAIKIFKAGRLPTMIGAYLTIKKLYMSLLKKIRAPQAELRGLDFQSAISTSASERFIQKLKRHVNSFLTLPDGERNWIIPAVFKAIREIKRNNIGCILTSCPPYSVHLIGLLVKIMTGVKWVADFRDPWMTPFSKRLYSTCELSIKIERWLEKKVIQKTDMIVTNSNRLYNTLKESYFTQAINKFHYIPNGIDMGRFSKLKHLKKYETFTIIYAGSVYMDRTPEPVFDALKDLIREGTLNPRDITVKLVGHCQYVKGIPIAQIIKKYDLDAVVEVLELVPYSQVLEMIKRSHIALLLAPNQPYALPAKVYDYMGLGTKILALAEEGETTDFIKSTGVGAAFPPLDIKGIKNFLLHEIKGELSRSEDQSKILGKFDAKVISENIAHHLDRICTMTQFERV